MKLRSLATILLSVSWLFSLALMAQDQPQTNPAGTPPPAAPLQLQETPATTSPAVLPDAGATSPATPLDTNASSPAATNGASSNSLAPTPSPSPALGEPASPAPDSGMGSPGQNPPPSDPNSLIPPPQEPEQPSPINTGENAEKQRQDQKARYYVVKVKADKEEALRSLLEQADKAKSDEAKRQALRSYYDLLAKRMKKIYSTLADLIDTMHAAYLRSLAQVIIEPTIPMNPPPSVDAAAQASPSPEPSATPTHKKKKRRPVAATNN